MKLLFILACIVHHPSLFLIRADFQVNVDVYPLEVTEGDHVTVRCEVSEFYNTVPFGVSLLCPYVDNAYCFTKCDSICKQNNDCEFKELFSRVSCHKPDGDGLMYTYVFRNVSTSMNQKKGFACKFQGKMSEYRRVFVKRKPSIYVKPTAKRPVITTKKTPEVHVYTEPENTQVETPTNPIPGKSRGTKKSDPESLVYLVLAVIIILAISVIFTILASIRCVMIEILSSNSKSIPMNGICCYASEIIIRRRHNGNSNNEYDVVPDEPSVRNNGTMSPQSMISRMTQMTQMTPLTPSSYRRQQSFPGYQFSLPSYNRSAGAVPPYTTQNSYEMNHYPTYGGHHVQLPFLPPPGYDNNGDQNDMNYSHQANGHLPTTQPKPMLPNTELQLSRTQMSDSYTTFTDDGECLPSVPGYVSRTASECFYNSYPELPQQKVRSVEAFEVSKINAEMIRQFQLNNAQN